MERYDLIIIGGGPGGYRSAERGGKAGLKTLLIEKNEVGGVCLNEGCIPSKVFLHSAQMMGCKNKRVAYFSLEGNVRFDQEQVVKNKDRVVKRLVAGIKASLKSAGVTIVFGEGKIRGKAEGAFEIEVGEKIYVSKNVIIATGSSLFYPKIEGLLEGVEKGYVLTSKEILDLGEIPDKLVVIGGGVIGLELGSYFKEVGSEVTVIEMLDWVGGPIDRDAAEVLKKSLEKKGMKFEMSSKVIKVDEREVFYEKEGKTFSVAFDKVLFSIGRKVNVENIGLEKLDIAEDRGIKVNKQMETTEKGVYAVGDVTGVYMLAHVAYREADVAINNILKEQDEMSYSAIPAVIYTAPELGEAGENEETAKKKGLDVRVERMPMLFSGRYVAESEDRTGFIKIIYDEKTDTILGATTVGPYSSEYIGMLSSFIGLKTPVSQLKKLVYPHPTVSEIFRDILFEI